MLNWIRNYLHFVSVEEAIIQSKEDTNITEDEIAFTEKFLIPYLSSAHADHFLSHENNALFRWEYIIKFELLADKAKVEQVIWFDPSDTIEQSPRQAWKQFIRSRMQNIR